VTVHRFLVTAEEGPKFDFWPHTVMYANWIEGRENPRGGETWLVTERYELRVGEPGSGWVETKP
jgi:hypothetical protein